MNWRVLTQSYTAIPMMLLAILAMMILPLPGWLLDTLFTFNIVLAVLVLLVSVSARRPLDFSVFPTVLLVATLMRLSLNVASTRVVLLHGHEGHEAAGKVIQAFGEVVIGGNYVVGLVVFVILMIINFVVITKGGADLRGIGPFHSGCHAGQTDGDRCRSQCRHHGSASGKGKTGRNRQGSRLLRSHGRCVQIRTR